MSEFGCLLIKLYLQNQQACVSFFASPSLECSMQQHTLIEIVTFADSLALRGSHGQWDMNRLLWWRSAKAIFLRKKMSPLPSPFSFSFLSLTWAQSLEQQQPSCDDEVTVMRMMMTRCLHHLRMMPTSKTDVSIYLPCGTGSALGSLPSDFLFGVQINPYLFKPLLVKFSIFFFSRWSHCW